ncbi:MAG: cyclic-phosphate processing receiver domain-containing protein [Deltaproteobacteria bacterium]|nr:cyclic-phosphate processing receiver domain-containing protein [Deltaproteobacteria bacterium]
MARILFLDDDPVRCARFAALYAEARVVMTAPQAIAALRSSAWEIASLDHDLGGKYYVDSARDDTGMGVVRWMVDERPAVGHVIVHSFNDQGAGLMVEALRAAGYRTTRLYFGVDGYPEALPE